MKQTSVTPAAWWFVFWRCRVLPSLVLTVPSSSAPRDSSTVPYTGHTAPYRSLKFIIHCLSFARRVQSGAITVVMYSANKWSSKVWTVECQCAAVLWVLWRTADFKSHSLQTGRSHEQRQCASITAQPAYRTVTWTAPLCLYNCTACRQDGHMNSATVPL